MDIDKLRYPIGKYEPGDTISIEEIQAWRKDISNFPKVLKQEVEALNDKQLGLCYRPGSWSIHQVVHHCADSHMNAFIRFKLALTEDKPTIKPYEEAKWAKLGDVTNVDVEVSINLLLALHQRWTALLESIPVTAFGRKYLHPQLKMEIDLAYTVGMYSWHCKHHLAHIKNAKKLEQADWNK